jgi:competence protein ComEC
MENTEKKKISLAYKTFLWLLLSIFAYFGYTIFQPTNKPDETHVYFLSVGQGDAELIQRGDYQILIDGGPDDAVLQELGRIMPTWDRKIEMIVLTHPHADHLVGINAIFDRYEIGAVYGSGVVDTTSQYLEFLENLKSKNMNLNVANTGQLLVPFQDGTFAFLWPGTEFVKQGNENMNNTSVITKFCDRTSCYLFTGDAEQIEQKAMLQYYEEKGLNAQLGVDVVKVSHHGSKNGGYDALYDIAKPKYAVIEVGKDNMYGHPTPTLLEILDSRAIKYFRTDTNGTIDFWSDSSNNLQYKTAN